MKINALLAAFLASALCLSGCKLVKTDEIASKAAETGESGDEARIAALLSETYNDKLVPDLHNRAVDIKTLKTALAESLDKAGEAHGVRAGGQGGAWNFSIKGEGTVVEENLKSKAATASLDVNGDGEADAVLQLGPIVKGTAIRDVAPELYQFSSFRDQIEFAKLGRALNKKAVETLPSTDESWVGRTVTFMGVAAMRSAKDKPLIVPVDAEFVQ